MSNFTDVDDFRSFVTQFDYNKPTRMALPLLISTKISGIGFALACDCLKELGFLSYPKGERLNKYIGRILLWRTGTVQVLSSYLYQSYL